MEIRTLPLGAFQTNCYLVINTDTKHALVIDPGSQGKELCEYIQKEGLEVDAVLLTHAHFDHIGAVDAVCERWHAPLYMTEKDVPMLSSTELNLSRHRGEDVSVRVKPVLIYDGEILSLIDKNFRVIATSGHTKGGTCFYEPVEGILLSGDTLFDRSIGRTDLPGGDFDTLIASIREKLYILPDETVVYPGHGVATTIGRERRENPFTGAVL